MKAMFDKTKYTKWYVDETGQCYVSTTYQGRNPKLVKKTASLNKKRGYLYVRTSNKNLQVHRLVASAFLPNPDNKPEVNHKDGKKTNNHVSNLEWVTTSENAQHAIKNGLIKHMKKNEGNLKYSNEQCRKVLERVKSGMKYIEAGSIYNMPYSTVAHLVRGSRRLV